VLKVGKLRWEMGVACCKLRRAELIRKKEKLSMGTFTKKTPR
jgi:hypothetical protein